MRRGELSFEEEERFSRLSELPELLEGLGVGISGDSVMQALAWNLFAGAFDPPDEPAAPARYAYDAWARVQTLAVPVMTPMRLRLLKRGCSEYIGNRYRYARRRDVAWMLAEAKLLPIEARPFGSAAELDAICDALVELPIKSFSEPARDLLDQVMVSRRLIAEWCECAGLLPADEKLPEGCGHGRRKAEPSVSDYCHPGPGRPPSDLWPRVQELVTQLHLANPDRYGNEIALIVHAQLAKEFSGGAIMALSTLERRMKGLRDIARQSMDGQERPEADLP